MIATTSRPKSPRTAIKRPKASRASPRKADRTEGLDVHSFRTTHRTWAEIQGVHPVIIDKQLGHTTPGGGAALDAARSILASKTGRKHYLDVSLALFEARRSAEAVRELFDRALDDARKEGACSWPILQPSPAHPWSHRRARTNVVSLPATPGDSG